MKLFYLILLCVFATIQLSVQGITKYGQSTTTSTVFVSKNGQSGSGMLLNKNGQILVNASLSPCTVAPLCYNTSPGTFKVTGGCYGAYSYLWYKTEHPRGYYTNL